MYVKGTLSAVLVVFLIACAPTEEPGGECVTQFDCPDGWECGPENVCIESGVTDTAGGSDQSLPEQDTVQVDEGIVADDVTVIEDDIAVGDDAPAVDEDTVVTDEDTLIVDEDTVVVDDQPLVDEDVQVIDEDMAVDIDTADDIPDLDMVDDPPDLDMVDDQPDNDTTVACDSVTATFNATWADSKANSWTSNCTGTGCQNWVNNNGTYADRAVHQPPGDAETSTAYLVSPQYTRKSGCALTVAYDYRLQENSTTADSLKLEVCTGTCSSWTTVSTWTSYMSSALYAELADISSHVPESTSFKVRWTHYSPKVTYHYPVWVDNFVINGI